VIFLMRLTRCDYCGIAVREGGDPNEPFKRIDEYVARVNADGSFEVDHVLYRPTRDPRLALTPAR